jgi:hypothetical protein
MSNELFLDILILFPKHANALEQILDRQLINSLTQQSDHIGLELFQIKFVASQTRNLCQFRNVFVSRNYQFSLHLHIHILHTFIEAVQVELDRGVEAAEFVSLLLVEVDNDFKAPLNEFGMDIGTDLLELLEQLVVNVNLRTVFVEKESFEEFNAEVLAELSESRQFV